MLVIKAASRALQWTVVNLLGNHEIFVILGYDNYVNPAEDSYVVYGKDRNAAFEPGGEVFKANYAR